MPANPHCKKLSSTIVEKICSRKNYTAGKEQQHLRKDNFSRAAGSQISMAFMLGHISVALLPISISFSSGVKNAALGRKISAMFQQLFAMLLQK